jgi:hypothetical protein
MFSAALSLIPSYRVGLHADQESPKAESSSKVSLGGIIRDFMTKADDAAIQAYFLGSFCEYLPKFSGGAINYFKGSGDLMDGRLVELGNDFQSAYANRGNDLLRFPQLVSNACSSAKESLRTTFGEFNFLAKMYACEKAFTDMTEAGEVFSRLFVGVAKVAGDALIARSPQARIGCAAGGALNALWKMESLCAFGNSFSGLGINLTKWNLSKETSSGPSETKTLHKIKIAQKAFSSIGDAFAVLAMLRGDSNFIPAGFSGMMFLGAKLASAALNQGAQYYAKHHSEAHELVLTPLDQSQKQQ